MALPDFYAYTPTEVKMQTDALVIQDKLVDIVTGNTVVWGGFITISIGIAFESIKYETNKKDENINQKFNFEMQPTWVRKQGPLLG